MTLAKTLSAIALATVALATPVAAVTISTLADENDAVFSWGQPDTKWYGQTVSFANDVSLNSFTFRINDEGTSISYDAQIYAWDGDSATGASLFSSSSATAGVNSTMTSYSTATGALGLMAGDYVLFFEATSNGSANWGSVTGSDAYTGGDFVFQNAFNGDGIFDPWSVTFPSARDLAFSVEYDLAAIPLPAGGFLLIGALGGLAALRRRKTKKS